MYYRIKPAACGSTLAAGKIVLRVGAAIILLVLLVGMVPKVSAEEINGAAGSGAMPRTASAETPSESPAPTATPSPDEELGDQLKDGFSNSVEDVTGALNEWNGKVNDIVGNDFRFFLASAIGTVISEDLWTFIFFMFLVILVLSIYKSLKE